jgi:hypothetical protein
LARIDAALISATRLSPLTTAMEGMAMPGSGCHQSEQTQEQFSGRRRRAASPAWWHAEYSARRFHAAQRAPGSRPALSFISSNSARRRFSLSFLSRSDRQSARRIEDHRGGHHRANGPRPTSSTPATRWVCG